MLHLYINDQQQDCNEYAFTLTHDYNSQVNRSKNTRPVDLVRNQWIPDFTLESTLLTEKMPTTAEQWPGFLKSLQYSLDGTFPSLKRTQER